MVFMLGNCLANTPNGHAPSPVSPPLLAVRHAGGLCRCPVGILSDGASGCDVRRFHVGIMLIAHALHVTSWFGGLFIEDPSRWKFK